MSILEHRVASEYQERQMNRKYSHQLLANGSGGIVSHEHREYLFQPMAPIQGHHRHSAMDIRRSQQYRSIQVKDLFVSRDSQQT
jgi:hypothetical protein